VNTNLFPSPTVALSTFEAANTKLTNLISQAKGNSNIINQRNEQAETVHDYMLQLLDYVNPICGHDITKIGLSGFDASHEPQPNEPPKQAVINRVTEGKLAGTYKIFLKRTNRKNLGVSGKSHSKGDNRYYVQISTEPTNEASWTTVLEGAASTKLVFKGLVPGKNYIRVYAINSAGKGQPSVPYMFIPQL